MSDSGYPEPEGKVESIDPAELKRRLDAGEPVTLLDVRDRDELEEWRVEGASIRRTHVPFAKFLQAEVRGSIPDLAASIEGDGPVVAVCGRGEASAYVADLLSAAGVEAVNLAGGMRGWARVYESLPVTEAGGPATVYQYQRPASGCLAYMVVSGDEAAVVDPLRAFVRRYVRDAAERGASIRYAVDTHVHADHVSGVRALADETGAERVLPEGAKARGLAFEARTVADGDVLAVGEATLAAVHAPGHTTEMTSFAVGDALLTGDGLFVESVARPDLEADDAGAPALARTLHATLTGRLARRPDGTLVAPGHYSAAASPAEDGTYAARLGDLRERLGVFSMGEDEFVEYVLGAMGPRPANYERIVAVNLGRESVDDEEAFELELGPNNCAVAPAAAD